MKDCCLLLVILAGLSCRQQVPTTQPITKDITQSVYASGTIKSKNQYAVFPATTGIIKTVLIKEGDEVQKGQALLVLENEAAQLSSENARVAADFASISSNKEKLQEALVNIELTALKAQQDSALLQRQKMLWSSGIGSRNELEQRELALKNSTVALQTARLRYEQLQQQLQLTARQTRKTWQINATIAGDYTIRAATSGRVYQFSKKPGESVSPQTPVATIGDAADFILELQVDEHDVGSVRTGQQVWVTLDSYEGQVFEAVIHRIIPLVDERLRSLTVEAIFKISPAVLYPNLTAEANILIATKKNALLIPRSYLMEGDQVLLKDGRLQKVKCGLKDYQWVEILEGLSSGDIIKDPTP
ncbi:MAG: efflux RND transporter periplasmic adaptor subunit [Flavitalea sp.]